MTTNITPPTKQHFHNALSAEIWDMKYRLKGPNGTPVDDTIDATRRRVAKAVAAAETDPAAWESRFLDALDGFRFLPAGRIISGAGANRAVTLFNCFVMGTIPDTMAGIFDGLKEAALTMQQGGGIGYDFSTLRPKGATVKGVGADASGPLTFMDVWDSMCRTIMSAGSRRGAMMGVMRCDHPDIEAFIEAKKEPGRLRMFNLSVLVTDAFMAAVKADQAWDLVFGTDDAGAPRVYRTIQARDLWDSIMQGTYACAEPGVIFIDRINRLNNLYYAEEIRSTNPCGEQPLPPYGACLLGSINLAALVSAPFTADAVIDDKALADLVGTAVRFLDNVIDVSRFPLPEQEHEAKAKRRIGLGITGLADALIMCGKRYGSPGAVTLTERWMRSLQRAAYLASVDLAREKAAFPLYDRDKYLAGETIQSLDDDVRAAIGEHGIRNALLTSIAPTGTISLFADNVSSGLEPVFANEYDRRVLNPDGSERHDSVRDFAYAKFRALFGEDAPLPDAFVTAETLRPRDHLVMQAALQAYIDSSISKTINVPDDISFDAFKDVYTQAYEMGCKGCTTYRPNDITGSVLKTAPRAAPEPELPLGDALDRPVGAGATVHHLTQPLKRPAVINGKTYKIQWPASDHAMYITLNDCIDDAGRVRPFEIFINTKDPSHHAWTVALTRMISAVFRRGGDVTFVVDELKAVFDPQGGHWMPRPDGEKPRFTPSILAAIGDTIETHMVATGFMKSDEDEEAVPVALTGTDGDVGARQGSPCPKCHQPSLVRRDGCDTCLSCGHSKCG